MQTFNVKIKYISDFKNKMTDNLSRIYFHKKECDFISEVLSYLYEIKK